MLVRRLVAGRRHRHDRDMDDPIVRPADEVVEPGLLADPRGVAISEWIDLARIAVPADLEPGLLAGVPAQQHTLGWVDARSSPMR